VTQVATRVVAEADSEPERRRISDYLGDVSRLEAELATERKQNEELRAEVLYQRRRIEREEDARLQLMQLLDNSQRLLGNAQRHTQQLLGGNEAEIFTMALPQGPETAAEEAPTMEAAAPPQPKPRRRWWSRG
jgi:septal ring factor EnvC (AmiA/AmiB activator)